MAFFPFFKILPLFSLWCLVFALQTIIYTGDRLAALLLRQKQKSRWIRKGACQRTGLCCRSLAIEIPASWARHARVVRLFQKWYQTIHRFQPLGVFNGRLLVFECAHLSEQNTCGIYPFRPKLCREYPALTLWGYAEVHKGCGFYFVERSKLGSFEEHLKDQKHEKERIEFLKESQKNISLPVSP